jgi:GntR family transcriptional regulator/MocR family aminotransferase
MQRADPRAFPLRMWRRLLVECLGHAGENLIDYGDPIGLASLREAITDHVLPDRGIRTKPENVFIFAGAQLALNLVARLMVRPKGAIIIENPANQGASYLFESYQGKLIPLPVDENGLVVPALGNIRADFAYVTPSHQFPLGATLSLERRHQLIGWAERVNSFIVEDDYDSQFFYDGPPLPALKALNDDRVIYIGTFSKLLGAGLRIGFAVFPDEFVSAATTAKALLDNGPPWLEQATLQAFITRGSYARHARNVRQQYLRQRNCLIASMHQFFGSPKLIGTSSGTHLCWRLPPSLPNALKVQQLALSKRVAVYTIQDGGGEEYAPRRFTPRVLMLGYAALSEAEIRRGIVRLADVLNH